MSTPSPAFAFGVDTEKPSEEGSIASLKRSGTEARAGTTLPGAVGEPEENEAETKRGRTVSRMKPWPVVKDEEKGTASRPPPADRTASPLVAPEGSVIS